MSLSEEQRCVIERRKAEALLKRRKRNQPAILSLEDKVRLAGGGINLEPCDPERVQKLNECSPRQGGEFVLLWVQQDVRSQCNHALEFAINRANELDVPLVAVYGLTARFPDANARLTPDFPSCTAQTLYHSDT